MASFWQKRYIRKRTLIPLSVTADLKTFMCPQKFDQNEICRKVMEMAKQRGRPCFAISITLQTTFRHTHTF